MALSPCYFIQHKECVSCIQHLHGNVGRRRQGGCTCDCMGCTCWSIASGFQSTSLTTSELSCLSGGCNCRCTYTNLQNKVLQITIFSMQWLVLCLSSKNLNMYISYLNSDTVGYRTWPSVCITPRSQRHRCYGCGSWKCNLDPRVCFVCWMKHTVPCATLRTVDGKRWTPVGREVSVSVIINGRRNC